MTHDETPPPLTEATSWSPIDLTTVLNGTYKVQPPTYMQRTDGVALLYPGKVNGIHGESESGKSLLMHAVTAQELNAGRRALFIDFESDQATVVTRLLMLGATPEQISGNLHYIRPECSPYGLAAEHQAWEQLMQTRYSLAVIDGVTEAFSVYGVGSMDNDEVSAWGRKVPRQIAQRTGAAVVLIDHVTKSAEGRGRFAIGAQAKMSYLTGASYSVEVIAPIGVGMAGKLAIRIGKDRPGLVRPYGGEWRKSDRTQEIAVALIDSTDRKTIKYALMPPRDFPDTGTTDKLTQLSGDILQTIQDAPTPPSFRTIDTAVRGKQDAKRAAIQQLINTGQIETYPGPKNATLHRIPNNRDTHPGLKAV
ncbi:MULTISPECIES: AAA family ATPase [Arthrobacter]|uniref:AAA family ATPase n=1 Tax=Arthrobacter TaxID=1663 RepID=UPI0014050773|nr:MULTISPECIES: AAA family ATPase [Arthrobacter]MBT8159317.1 AAA family ATPase [Arthrobacter sp. GN70]